MISEGDALDSVSLRLTTCVNMGRSLCFFVSPSVTHQGQGVGLVTPGDSYEVNCEGLAVIENLHVFTQQTPGKISKNQSGI